jgi:DNA-directed RNA polymerase subunit F
MKKEAWEAKGQVPKHYRKQLLKVQKRVKEATKVSARTVTKILEKQKKHEAEGTSFSLHSKTHKVLKRVIDIDGISACEHVDKLKKKNIVNRKV